MHFGSLVSTLVISGIASASEITAAPAQPTDARSAIEHMFLANPDDAQLSVALRSYFENVAVDFKTVSGLEYIYDAATSIAAEITDNEAARNIMTSKIGHHTA